MKKYMKLLQQTRLFRGMKETDIEKILPCLLATEKEYKKGTYVFRAGDTISSVALLLEGSIYIQKEDFWGNLSILNEICVGELFGESYAAPGSGCMLHNALAVKDSTILLLNFQKMLTVCSASCEFHTQLIQNLFILLSEKNRMLAQKINHMSKRSTREKLLSYLSEQAQKANSSTFSISFNRQQLADYLSIDRSAMSNELSKMQREGILTFHKNQFTLKKNPLSVLSY